MSCAAVTGPMVMNVWMDEIVFGESPRWHDGRLWFSDWGAGRVWSVTEGDEPVLEAEVEQLMCIDFLPDGRLLVVSPADGGVLLRREPDGSLVTHADLSAVTQVGWNDIVADGSGRAYVNSIAFEFPGGEFRPGLVVLVDTDGSVRTVAEGLAFPNGMAISPDGSTLVVAESYGEKLTAYPIADDGSLGSSRVPGPRRPATTPTASASTPPARSGTPTSATSTASGCARAARCSTPSTPTAARSRARCRGRATRCCWSSARSGARTLGRPADRQLVAFEAPEHGDGWP